jgi:hypothetical protein
MGSRSARELVVQNPFYVLDVSVNATRTEVERAGQRWLAQLGVGAQAAQFYRTPLGEFERTPDLVRQSLAELRDPGTRLTYEIWRSEFDAAAVTPSMRTDYEEALRVIGWSTPWPSR